MRTLLTILVALLCLSLCSCDSSRQRAYEYDKGYEAGWEGEKAPSSVWASKEEKEGYEYGRADAEAYDEGYDDGSKGHRPKYLNDHFYMDGYKYGKEDKRLKWIG